MNGIHGGLQLHKPHSLQWSFVHVLFPHTHTQISWSNILKVWLFFSFYNPSLHLKIKKKGDVREC